MAGRGRGGVGPSVVRGGDAVVEGAMKPGRYCLGCLRSPNNCTCRTAVAPYLEWLKDMGLVNDGDETPEFNYKPTMELRWRGKVLEQKWIISEMAYTHKWVPIRRKSRKEK
jgi:hypothetical protein